MTPAPAFAGAWVAPEGGQRIWTELAGSRDEALYTESSYYIEAPIDSGVSFVAAPWVTQDNAQYGVDALHWEVTLAGKWAMRQRGPIVMAVQPGVVWNSDPLGHCAEAQAELRLLGGTSFGERRHFANVEVAERAGEGGCGGERLDLTVGYRLRERWLGMAQVFVDQPRLGEASVKAQISLVRFGGEQRGLQLGLRARIDGAAAEPAVVLGFWGWGNQDEE